MISKDLTQEEIQRLKILEKRKKVLMDELSQIGLSKLTLKNREELVEKYYKESITFEQELTTELQKKYGDGSIDLSTGKIYLQNQGL